MATQDDSILSKTFALLKFATPLVNKLPRDYKFTLGDRLHGFMADVLECYIEAYYAPPERKRALLNRANVLLEKLRYFFRLGYELGLYDSVRYQAFAERLHEIGKMTGGWIKSIK